MCCRNWLPLILVDGAYEAESLARQCLDQELLFAGVTDRCSSLNQLDYPGRFVDLNVMKAITDPSAFIASHPASDPG